MTITIDYDQATINDYATAALTFPWREYPQPFAQMIGIVAPNIQIDRLTSSVPDGAWVWEP